MKLNKEVLEAAVWGYMIGTGQDPHAKNGNGFVERSKHQRRRGRPPMSESVKRLGRPPKKRLGRPPKVAV